MPHPFLLALGHLATLAISGEVTSVFATYSTVWGPWPSSSTSTISSPVMHGCLYLCASESQKGDTIVVAVGWAEFVSVLIALNLLLGCSPIGMVSCCIDLVPVGLVGS